MLAGNIAQALSGRLDGGGAHRAAFAARPKTWIVAGGVPLATTTDGETIGRRSLCPQFPIRDHTAIPMPKIKKVPMRPLCGDSPIPISQRGALKTTYSRITSIVNTAVP